MACPAHGRDGADRWRRRSRKSPCGFGPSATLAARSREGNEIAALQVRRIEHDLFAGLPELLEVAAAMLRNCAISTRLSFQSPSSLKVILPTMVSTGLPCSHCDSVFSSSEPVALTAFERIWPAP